MDFAAERYVRLYVRDTATWSLLCWEARCVFPLLLRKVDGAGVIDIPEGRTPPEVVAKVLDVPEYVVEAALEDLAASGVVELGRSLVVVNFVEAQRCTSTDKARKAAQRERDRAISKRKNNRVTTGHEVSQDVTPCPTEPNRAEPSRTEPSSVAGDKRPTTKRQPSEDSCEIAQYLYDAIREHSPDFMAGAPPAKIESKLLGWARDIDVGLRNDGMTLDGCKAAIDVAHRSSDPFWRSNLMSGRALRKQYERLKVRKNGSKPPPSDYSGIPFNELREEMDQRWPTTK